MEELLQIMWSFVDGIIDPKYHVIDMNPFIEGWSGHALNWSGPHSYPVC